MPAADPSPRLTQIKASAGSGKTYDLTRRFLLQLEQARTEAASAACALGGPAEGGTAWGDIMAVTFTNAAAAEMKSRVIAALKRLALGGTPPEGVRMSRAQARAWTDRILRQYGALNIRTIDSLLHMVVRAAALELGLPPEFEPVFASEEALTPVLEAVTESARHDDETRRLLAEACRSLVYQQNRRGFLLGDGMLKQLRPLLDGALLHAYDGLTPEHELRQRLRQWRLAVMQAAETLEARAAEDGLLWKAQARESLLKLKAGSAGDHQDRWWQDEARRAWWSKPSLEECLLKKSPAPGDAAGAAFARLCAGLERLRGPGHMVRGALARHPFRILAEALAEGFGATVQEAGRVPSVLIPGMAASVLEEGGAAPEVLCRMGSRLTHFLIDEFQDTSREQWQALEPLVVEALSRGGSLTWVGDVKQAIYGWRGGDAALFDGIAEAPRLRAIVHDMSRNFSRATLDMNWRSRTAVVHANNALFSRLGTPEGAATVLGLCLPPDTAAAVGGPDGDATRALAGAFAGAAQQPCGAPDACSGHIIVEAVEGEDSEALAEEVRVRLLAAVNEVASRRPWGDMAVLVRANSTASRIAQWLMEDGIPVITENSLLLAEHPLIQQTVAFLRFLHSPADDVACFACMAGAAAAELPELRTAGFSRQALTDLAAEGPRGKPLHQKVRQRFPAAWERIFAPFFLQSGLMSPYDMVQEWFSRLDVAARFPEDAAFVRRFLEVLYAAEAQGHSTLPSFLEAWDTRGVEEKIPMSEGMDAVRVLTIHKSKGLEFPVVIIPWTNFSFKAPEAPVPADVEGMRVLTPLVRDMGRPYHRALAAAAQESLHLLYVACTRARDELICFQTSTPAMRRSGYITPALCWMLEQAGMALPHVAGMPVPCAPGQHPARPRTESTAAGPLPPAGGHIPAGDADNAARQAAASPSEADFPDDWRPMGWLPRLKVYRNPLGALLPAAEPGTLPGAQAHAREEPSGTQAAQTVPTPGTQARMGALRGTLMHAALEHLRMTGHPRQDAEAAVRHALRTSADPVPDMPGLEEGLVRGVTWFASLPDARLWKEHGVPEQSLLDADGREHRVDLLLETADGFLALEFKTGAPEDAHVAQVRRYLALLEELDGCPARGLLLYLDRHLCQCVWRDELSAPLPSPEACGAVCRMRKEEPCP